MQRTFAWGAAGSALLLVAIAIAGAAGAPARADARAADSLDVPRQTVTDGAVRHVETVHAPPTVPEAKSGAVEAPVVVAAQAPACPVSLNGAAGGAPSAVSPLGVGGTTSADIASFAAAFNATRVANCLSPIPFSNFRYDSCMEARLFWMAEDPSTNPSSAWGHMGSVRSDGLPSVGCDGNLAGGLNNTGQTVAIKWWESPAHRASLYEPGYTGSTAGVCIFFAMTHGGIPDEPAAFTRAAARWGGC